MALNPRLMQRTAHVHERAAHVHRFVAAFWERQGQPHRAEAERTAARVQQDAADRLRWLSDRGG